MTRRQTHPAGLSLVEVLLALAILAVAMGLLGHLTRIAGRQAAAAQQLTHANVHAQSIMAQLAAEVIPLESVQRAAMATTEDYLYSIDVQSLELEGLLSVTVTVEANQPNDPRPTSVELVRWLIDPEYLAQLAAEAAAEAEAQAAEAEADAAA